MATAFPVGGRAIIEAMVAKFPDLAVNDDDIQRQLTIKIGEQFRYTFGERWGGKKRTGSAPRSKDSIAVKEDDGTLSVWDMFSASVEVLPNDGDLPKPVTHAHLPPGEAEFIADEPVNHLGIEQPDPGTRPPNPGTPPPVDLRELRMMLTDALVSLEELKETVGMLSGLVASLQMRHDPLPKLLDIEAKQKRGYKGRVELPGWLGGARPVILEPME